VSYTQEMKKIDGFWQSLEQYFYKTARRSPLPWSWVGIGVVSIAMLLSLLNVKNSVASAENTREIIEKASGRGDYETARKYFEQQVASEDVLGANSELENKVYPDRAVEQRILELEEQLRKTPNHFEMFLELSRLNKLIGQEEPANEYREKARVLDPNNAIFK
jgi:tetratricopeptide (TPR) repeat protein